MQPKWECSLTYDEKPRIFIFLPELAYVKTRNMVGFYFWKYFLCLNPPIYHKLVTAPRLRLTTKPHVAKPQRKRAKCIASFR